MIESHQIRILHALRIALAFVCTFMVVHMLGIHERSWPLITVVVVLVPTQDRKGLFYRAAQRIAGTFLGAAIGLLALWVETFSQPAMIVLCAFGASLCGYFYHSRHPYAALIMGVTMAVVVNAPAGDIHTALMRILGVLLGCLLATFFGSVFVIRPKQLQQSPAPAGRNETE